MDRLLTCFSWIPCLMKSDYKPVEVPTCHEKKELTIVERKLARLLYDACWDGDVIGCIDLLDKGAPADVPFGVKNYTALHAAVKIGNLSVSQFQCNDINL